MKKSLFIAAIIGAAAASWFAISSGVFAGKPHPAAAAASTLATASFAIENMTCATCPISVRNAMMRVEGVTAVDVDFDSKIATVEYDPAIATPQAIGAASDAVGYPASRIDA